MSYEARIAQVVELITNYNKSLPDGMLKMSPDAFVKSIKVMGASTEEHLKRLSYEEILKVLPELNGVKPILLAKDIAKIFRGTEEKEVSKIVTAKSADKMTPAMLVAHYDPYDADNAVGSRLKSMSKGEPFVVLTQTNQVNHEVTIELLAEIRKGYEGRTSYTSKDGIVHPVYRVGEVPDNFADENPIFAGRPLRPDGTCDQTGRSWEGVALSVRQLVRVALMTNEITATIDKAHDIMDLAIDTAAWKKLSQRYIKATLKFKELEGTGNLPTLKIKLGRTPKSPFGQGKKVVQAGMRPKESYDYGSWATMYPTHIGSGSLIWFNGNWINATSTNQ